MWWSSWPSYRTGMPDPLVTPLSSRLLIPVCGLSMSMSYYWYIVCWYCTYTDYKRAYFCHYSLTYITTNEFNPKQTRRPSRRGSCVSSRYLRSWPHRPLLTSSSSAAPNWPQRASVWWERWMVCVCVSNPARPQLSHSPQSHLSPLHVHQHNLHRYSMGQFTLSSIMDRCQHFYLSQAA